MLHPLWRYIDSVWPDHPLRDSCTTFPVDHRARAVAILHAAVPNAASWRIRNVEPNDGLLFLLTALAYLKHARPPVKVPPDDISIHLDPAAFDALLLSRPPRGGRTFLWVQEATFWGEWIRWASPHAPRLALFAQKELSLRYASIDDRVAGGALCTLSPMGLQVFPIPDDWSTRIRDAVRRLRAMSCDDLHAHDLRRDLADYMQLLGRDSVLRAVEEVLAT